MSDSSNSNILWEVEQQAQEMAKTERLCERGYAHLGWLILHVAEMQYWRVNFLTFRDYLKSIALIAKKTPDQLQRYFLTVRDLSDTFRPEQLEAIGITKAMQLRQAKGYALVLPQSLITAALDSKVNSKELRKLISVTLRMPDEEGDWFDAQAEFMVSPEERATLEDAFNAAIHTDPITEMTLTKSGQMKDIMLKLCMNFLADYSGNLQK